ncbi:MULTISPECIES: LLM class oxidoreductase [Paenibacillus]|uniref:LLM class oxidoreductase n=1 Tax=Paenibacillus TaxID=44249 RepID=UPI00020D7C22|nr:MULTISPECIES: LLM class oxidoreductase [Paenibacillus]EGL16674.1 luciferase-type oxidoreductase, BA3436 family [Paenibacillus sp. HGF7]EPD80677.1 BA3436 family luciferase-type oxidoreductase [Paenibacillus sp. HGH0039]MBV6714541.1 LLM class oxidoreductase [Paenibacillus chitinolyticus]
MDKFASHTGYSNMFKEKELTLGLHFPLESYTGSIPEMDLEHQMNLAKKAEEARFASLFVRDVPLNVPSFGDAGQLYDPWVFLGYLAAHTKQISLGTASIVTTLRHPLHVAKAAASVDRISGKRLVLGIATGDRPSEFSAFSVDREQRSNLFRESLHVMRKVWNEEFPEIYSPRLNLQGGDLLPKPELKDIPILVTGHSTQTPKWIAENSDGWFYYPRNINNQAALIKEWRTLTNIFKPFSQSLYIDLSENPNEDPSPIHLGFRTGHQFLIDYLNALKEIGVNHLGFNLKYGQRPVEEVIQELGEEVVPFFPALSNKEV